jgi:hypothetical protein
MPAMGAGNIILGLQVGTNTCGAGFLPDVQVHKPREFPFGKKGLHFFLKYPYGIHLFENMPGYCTVHVFIFFLFSCANIFGKKQCH